MHIVVVGLSHKTAPVEIREKLSFPSQTIGEPLNRLCTSYEINEGVIVSTCNRVEIFAVTRDAEKGLWHVKKFLSDYHNIPLEQLDEHLYSHTSEDAVKHLFRVCAGLDSMVLGEPQILGQAKDAYGYALQHKTAGVIMNKLFHKSFSVAKRIRTETKIGSNAVSISYAAVELAKKIFNSLTDKSVMLIGAGEMAELAAKHLLSSGVQEIIVANRTYEKAVEMARCFKGTPIMFREFTHYLKKVDIIIVSTAAPKYIIHPEQIEEVIKERKNRSMFFIDISVPRNVDPLINNIDNIYLYNVDDLQGVVAANLKERAKEAKEAENIINEEIDNFYRWVKSLDVVPTIVALKKKLEDIRKGEMEKALSMVNGLQEKDIQAIDAMTRAIINKIIHDPVTHLKKEANKVEGDFYIEAARRLFDLNEESLKGEEKLVEKK
ncbi:MAG: glutamyl-tRNA reductase [Deltaproteobacteria bacterium RIFCSPLOWO2_12_FULL_43_16]|nr:MAG: glutamyl-tRNA reductase [Deltaproteobacteria bacterium GWA2_43_19]OGQ11254.1 MAG: glutamyl-tRNA reductase [Deltaproteobacteria bacterium RIFCSPHIGHO2_02_FULL_43_33]OGQ60450.1 MAG: glutamyl-tRNA reductase [Deltaproteobacteria bacterium RIFCSPLOWO2_12_FULL_43_16]HBR17462.1 glutamyl-tRNA reductase [Deltaproteobacteria bacterium]